MVSPCLPNGKTRHSLFVHAQQMKVYLGVYYYAKRVEYGTGVHRSNRVYQGEGEVVLGF